jgi:hypothetical protein
MLNLGRCWRDAHTGSLAERKVHQIIKVGEVFRNEVDSPEAGIRVGGREGHVRVSEVVFRDDVRETRGQERCRAECTKMGCMTNMG